MKKLQTISLCSPDYLTARGRFREAALRLGCALEAHPIGAQGPDGEELTIDVAITPGNGRDGTLVISSGIHGVEGFLGSALQLGLLDAWRRNTVALPTTRCVLLHGLNPFGFAWRRRGNETNVDLNRNLLLPNEAFSGSPAGYAQLDPLLNPKCPPSSFEPVKLKFLLAIARHGMPALKEAVASGQYDFPQGLFYGGAQPSRTSEILSAHFDEWLGDSTQVVHLDLHTGLGKWGSYKLLVDYPLNAALAEQLGAWFGPTSFEASHSRGVAYSTRGSFGRWCVARYPDRAYRYAAVEFGTYQATSVVAGLRAENQAHHWGAPSGQSMESAKQRLMELFCPKSEPWRAQVLTKGYHVVDQAIRGLARIRWKGERPAGHEPL